MSDLELISALEKLAEKQSAEHQQLESEWQAAKKAERRAKSRMRIAEDEHSQTSMVLLSLRHQAKKQLLADAMTAPDPSDADES